MNKKQRTIEKPVSLEGIGLHTGCRSTITFRPAPVDHWITFKRTDVEGSPEILAIVDHVSDLNRGTTLAVNGVKVHTVEHVLAAISGLGIDNLTCELDNVEPPVFDGSVKPFVDKLLEAGIVDQDADRRYLTLDESIAYSEPERKVDIVVTPSDDLRITFMIDYANPALGTQYTSLVSLKDEFVEEFAPARTFCFLSEVEMMKSQGIIKGGGLDSAIVIVDKEIDEAQLKHFKEMFNIDRDIELPIDGILDNKKLRFYNEPVRHKAVDLLGDMMLIGVPVKAHFLAARSGHAANVAVAKKIRSMYEKQLLSEKYGSNGPQQGYLLDISAILNILPHRYPFLLIDRILDLEPEKRVSALKNVTINEPFFQGHFPDHPIMPGVLIVEAMAQAGGFLLLETIGRPKDKLVYFMGMDKVKFRKPVIPGDQITFDVELVSFRRNICKMSGKAFVDGQLVTEATLMAAVIDRDQDVNN
jgi:UDP-3-O-[3-hydroxymyristoyl] N-acetylglucosamine deacetylase/3-hydroxyacyl-[acyl-carrier-protein] dehydratase